MIASVLRRSGLRREGHRIDVLRKHLPSDDPSLREAGCGPSRQSLDVCIWATAVEPGEIE